MQVKQIHGIAEIGRAEWNALAGSDYPFRRHEFLLALEASGSVSERTGWPPRHLLVYQENQLVAALPLYLKSHSSGEFVFDHQWAAAYQRQGLAYYPKWLSAIPLTPCPGPRLLCAATAKRNEVMQAVFDFIREQSAELNASSWHCLFPEADEAREWQALGLQLREGVQFHWFNKGYRDFADYLETFNAAKRKMVKRERRKVQDAGIEICTELGRDLGEDAWQTFYRFYTSTYFKNGMRPYLNVDFFIRCAATLGEQLLMTWARKDGQTVAAALSFLGSDTLYGRYWGGLESFDALHFEACYYQGLDYCIRHGLKQFDSGAQGEHKIARGFEPVTTYSVHWLQDTGFADAVARFLQQERLLVEQYRLDAAKFLPFKK